LEIACIAAVLPALHVIIAKKNGIKIRRQDIRRNVTQVYFRKGSKVMKMEYGLMEGSSTFVKKIPMAMPANRNRNLCIFGVISKAEK
tara:strand:+ start:235 stop:495 length:261 start_codon:yes stop_codon:yes gene_type:complete